MTEKECFGCGKLVPGEGGVPLAECCTCRIQCAVCGESAPHSVGNDDLPSGWEWTEWQDDPDSVTKPPTRSRYPVHTACVK